MKLFAKWNDDKSRLYFGNMVYVTKLSDNMYGVFGRYCREVITSGETFGQACKKAKLIALGYNMGYNDAKDCFAPDYDY